MSVPACSRPCRSPRAGAAAPPRCEARFGAKPPSSPTVVGHALRVDQLLQRVEDLGAVAQRLAKRRRAERHDHELLHVDAVVGVRAAVDHVHQRHRQLPSRPRRRDSDTAAASIPRPPPWPPRTRPRGSRWRRGATCSRCRRGRSCVLSMKACSDRVEPDDRFADLGVDVLDRLLHALAAVARRVAVAQLDRLLRAGRRARRHGGAAADARTRARRRLRRWDCRANRGSRGR